MKLLAVLYERSRQIGFFRFMKWLGVLKRRFLQWVLNKEF